MVTIYDLETDWLETNWFGGINQKALFLRMENKLQLYGIELVNKVFLAHGQIRYFNLDKFKPKETLLS